MLVWVVGSLGSRPVGGGFPGAFNPGPIYIDIYFLHIFLLLLLEVLVGGGAPKRIALVACHGRSPFSKDGLPFACDEVAPLWIPVWECLEPATRGSRCGTLPVGNPLAPRQQRSAGFPGPGLALLIVLSSALAPLWRIRSLSLQH